MLQNIIESLQGTDFDGLGKYELLANDSNFIKNKIFYTEWILKNTQPQLYQTKKKLILDVDVSILSIKEQKMNVV